MESPSDVLNDSGVYLPAFESVTEGGSDFGMTGLGRGGQQVQRLGLHGFKLS
jgi:hypothetical protein